MRQLANFLAVSLSAALGATAYDAFIYTFDPYQQSPPSHGGSISQDAARLILERRMKPSQSSLLGSANEEVVDWLNQFGGQQASLFGSAQGHDGLRRLLVVFEGVDHRSVSAIPSTHSNDLNVRHLSSDSISDDFLETLVGVNQEGQGDFTTCVSDIGSANNLSDDLSGARDCFSKICVLREALHAFDGDFVRLFPSTRVESWSEGNGSVALLKIGFQSETSSSNLASVSNVLQSLFSDLASLASESEQESTVLLLPPLDPPEENQKLRARYDSKEDILSKSSSSSGVLPESYVVHSLQHGASVPSTLMPICHSSDSSCIDATNNCSGHGHCYRKYASKDEAARSDCYACKCVETEERREDGTIKRTQWGGPACQKRDVSTPLFLLAGITMLVIVAVSGGIGMLFSVGQEELPSVIGAGVGAPRAQR